jgi:predicted RNase H-like HicB family nuclease
MPVASCHRHALAVENKGGSFDSDLSVARNRGDDMSDVRQLTAVIQREGDGYVASCPELDIVSQGNTVEEARLHLVEAVEGFFEAASPSEIQRRWQTETYVTSIMPTMPSRQAIKVAS